MFRQVIVSGFHRSGTSMTMQALVRAGLYIGDSLIGADPTNPDGHFEDIETVDLHNQWLRECDSDWCHTGTLPILDEEYAASGIAPIEERLSQQGRHWGLKDPRACLFLPFWFNNLSNPAGVFVYRHFASCWHSLQTRQAKELLVNPDPSTQAVRLWTDPELGLKTWLAHNKSILSIANQYPDKCLVVSQEALIAGAPIIQAVNDKLSLSLNGHCDIGIDASKSVRGKSLSVLDTQLKNELEDTWVKLQNLSTFPAEQFPQVQWVAAQTARPEQSSTTDSLVTQWDRLGVA